MVNPVKSCKSCQKPETGFQDFYRTYKVKKDDSKCRRGGVISARLENRKKSVNEKWNLSVYKMEYF